MWKNIVERFRAQLTIWRMRIACWITKSTDTHSQYADCVWNVMAHAQKPYFVFRRNGRVHLNRRGRQFSRLLSAEVWASAVVMLDTPCSEVVWRVLATHSIRQFPLSLSHPCVTVRHQVSNALYTVPSCNEGVNESDHGVMDVTAFCKFDI